jgi:hypothetical protein
MQSASKSLMNKYIVLKHQSARPVVIRSGFNLWCFFFGIPWSLLTGTWLVFWMHLVMQLVSATLISMSYDSLGVGTVLSPVCVAWNVYIAIYANQARVDALKRRGYRETFGSTPPARPSIAAPVAAFC